MICVVLEPGYATRLYPLTGYLPKPLQKLRDKTILDWLLDDAENALVERCVVISNCNFIKHFNQWSASKKFLVPITIFDNGSESNKTRSRAVRDIKFAIEELKLDDELLIIAGDNVIDFSLKNFLEYAKEKPVKPDPQWRRLPFYNYMPTDATLINAADEEGCGMDTFGSFIAWLCAQTQEIPQA